MQPIATDGVARSVGLYVCRSATIVSPVKTAEPIEMPFDIWTRVGPGKHVLDAGVHWRHLANMSEPSMCGGDAALCRITLATSYHLLLNRRSPHFIQMCQTDATAYAARTVCTCVVCASRGKSDPSDIK